MKKIFTIALKEIKSSFVTPLAYVVMAGFLVLCGFFFFSLLQQFNVVVAQSAMLRDVTPNLNEWVIVPFYQTLEVVLIFLVPILTMRSFAEEKRSGTFELLATSPLTISQLVLGKFLGASFVVLVLLLLSLIFPLVTLVFANPEVAPILVGFFGLLLFSFAFTAIGIAISATTRAQTIAGVVSMVVLLVFFICDAPADRLGEPIASLLKYLAPSSHSETLLKGVLSGSDVVYFLSVMFVGIFIANRVLDAGRWR